MTPFKERGGLVKALGSGVKIAADGEVGVNTLGDGYFVAEGGNYRIKTTVSLS